MTDSMNTSSRVSSVLVNISDVDDALPRLQQKLEQLQVAILNNEDWPLLEEGFNNAVGLAIRTFRREEEAMDLCHDRTSLAHKSAHQMFLKKLSAFKAKCSTEGPTVALAQDMRTEVISWLFDHHRIMNASLGRTVKDLVERSKAYHESTNTQTSVSA